MYRQLVVNTNIDHEEFPGINKNPRMRERRHHLQELHSTESATEREQRLSEGGRDTCAGAKDFGATCSAKVSRLSLKTCDVAKFLKNLFEERKKTTSVFLFRFVIIAIIKWVSQ